MDIAIKKARKGMFILFLVGEVLAFGFITLLQFIDVKTNLLGFVLTLIAMHGGILCFILSKRLFKIGIDVKRHYLVEYILLALYLPILALKIAGVHIEQGLKQTIVIAITAVCVVVSAINDIKLYKKLAE